MARFLTFENLNDEQFEELCYLLVKYLGFINVEWRKKGADDGRDIQADYAFTNMLDESITEKYFFECKHYKNGISPEILNSKLAWADAENPDHLVIFVSSHLTTPCRRFLEKIKTRKSYKIHTIEGVKLKELIEKNAAFIYRFDLDNDRPYIVGEIINEYKEFYDLPNMSKVTLAISSINLYKLALVDLIALSQICMLCYNRWKIELNEGFKETILDEAIGMDFSKFILPILKRKEKNQFQEDLSRFTYDDVFGYFNHRRWSTLHFCFFTFISVGYYHGNGVLMTYLRISENSGCLMWSILGTQEDGGILQMKHENALSYFIDSLEMLITNSPSLEEDFNNMPALESLNGFDGTILEFIEVNA